MTMIKIDSHQHFWNYDPIKYQWIDEEKALLKRDFLPADLKIVYKANGIDGCIAVQANQSEQETHFLFELAGENDFIKGVVGWIDLRAAGLEEGLEHFSEFPSVCGFRHVVQDEPDPEFMLQKSFQRGIGRLEKYGYTYDILIFPNQMEAGFATVQNFPNQKFVLDHIAKPYIKRGEIAMWKRQIEKLAEYDNTYCKVSGMVTEADWKNWEYQDFVPYLDVVFEAFGVDRIMYGSDWPVCLLAAQYNKVKAIFEKYISEFSSDDKRKLWGANALEFYNV